MGNMSCPVKMLRRLPRAALQAIQERMQATGGKCPFQDIVKATAPAVAPKVPEIVNDFYPRMFKNNPETKAFFNPANQFADPPLQRQALGNAVVAYASNIDNLEVLGDAVNLIAHKHCALGVKPEHYPIVHDNLMQSIAHVMGDAATPEVAGGWSEAVDALAGILISTEEGLYKAAEQKAGGWRGTKEFKVVAMRHPSDDTAEVTFGAVDGSSGPIDFTPGQYTTVNLRKEGATPRHYTLVGKPSDSTLQVCVKAVKGGFVSNGVHELKVGDVVDLAAPYGLFKMQEGKGAVLLSAGVGVTPMRSFLNANRSAVQMAVHVDKAEGTHPYRQEFIDAGVKTSFFYSGKSGRPSPQAIVAEMKDSIKDNVVYMCGPPSFMAAMKPALADAGATVVSENFGPELAG